MLPQTRLSSISLALIAVFITSCQDVIESEFSQLDNQQIAQVISREQIEKENI
jgi:hypothetical protein